MAITSNQIYDRKSYLEEQEKQKEMLKKSTGCKMEDEVIKEINPDND